MGFHGIMLLDSSVQSTKLSWNVSTSSLWKPSLSQLGKYGNKEMHRSSEEFRPHSSLEKIAL